MSRAFCLIRDQPSSRADAFRAGLKAAGYEVRGAVSSVESGDVVCMWNRYSENHEIACRVEKAGATVIVAENGYLGPGGVSPHQMDPREWYALAVGGHNGSGAHHVGGPERWNALNVELRPWRTQGDHILVLPNRSFGRPDLIMPYDWPRKVVERLQKVTGRPIRVRPHPGNGRHKTPLNADLENAWACVIWSSSAGVQALIRGTPVVCEAPAWICRKAAELRINAIDRIELPDRLEAMRAMAWAQWHVDEIATGEPFYYLLNRERLEFCERFAAAVRGC